MVVLVAILGHGLGIMARLTQRLPVFLVPEQLRVTPMRDDVIDNRCGYNLTHLLAAYTQWVGSKESFPGSLPPSVVAFLLCGFGIVIMKWGVFLTVHRAIGNKPCTTGMLAWGVRSVRHGLFLPRYANLAEVTIGTDLVIIHI